MKKVKNRTLNFILLVLSIFSIIYLSLELFDKLNIKYLAVICYAIIFLFLTSVLVGVKKSESDH
jgi:4-amino-4-deoxy-L-arabinose transferase-like glycosyltransferase